MSFFEDLQKAMKMFDLLDEATQLRIIQNLEQKHKRYSNREQRQLLAKHIYGRGHRRVLEMLQQATRGLSGGAKRQKENH